jgi:hypothetical protein
MFSVWRCHCEPSPRAPRITYLRHWQIILRPLANIAYSNSVTVHLHPIRRQLKMLSQTASRPDHWAKISEMAYKINIHAACLTPLV